MCRRAGTSGAGSGPEVRPPTRRPIVVAGVVTARLSGGTPIDPSHNREVAGSNPAPLLEGPGNRVFFVFGTGRPHLAADPHRKEKR
jgi:hypothetical protein